MNSGEPAGRAARLDDLLIKTSRTFALSIPRLPEPLRREVTLAYLLFRIADTLEDATRWPAARQLAELDALARLLGRPSPAEARRLASSWLADPPLEHPGYLELLGELAEITDALAALGAEPRRLVVAHTLRTIDCMASFVRRSGERGLELRDLADLQAYCYAVAGIVGEMLTELFLVECRALDPIAAALRADAGTFGEALQLVNILKDSAADVGEGRSYLPAAVDRARVFALARADLAGAGRYVRGLQAAGAPRGLVAFTALPVLLASHTLDRVEAAGPGAKLSRAEVEALTRQLELVLDRGEAAVPEGVPSPRGPCADPSGRTS